MKVFQVDMEMSDQFAGWFSLFNMHKCAGNITDTTALSTALYHCFVAVLSTTA